MKIQVLASIMMEPKNSIKDIINRMNIQTDAIIINQCNENFIEEYKMDNSSVIKMLSFNERGVGLSRNNALMRATRRYCCYSR